MLADRVKETSTTTGTGTLTLGGAAAGFRTFAAGVGNGNKCHYVIENATVPSEWEIGIGTATATPDQLSRDTVLSSSNGGSLVNFSAGTKSVFVSAVANNFEADLTDALGSVSGSVTLKVNHYQTITATIGGATTFSFDGWPSVGTPFRSLILTNGGSAAITWPTITWVDGAAPTLQTTGVDRIDLWRTGGVVYGKLVKQTASSGGVTATVTLADNVTVGDFVAALNSGSVERVKGTLTPNASAGAEYVFLSASAAATTCAFDESAQRVVIFYSDGSVGKAVVVTASGDTLSFGTPVTFSAVAIGSEASAYYDAAAQKVVVVYTETSSGYGYAIVGAVSGTSISFGTKAAFISVAGTAYPYGSYNDGSSKGVITYKNGSDLKVYGIVATVSGTSISFGTAVAASAGSAAYGRSGYNPATGKTLVTFADLANSNRGTAVVATISGTSVSFGTPSNFTAGGTDISPCAAVNGQAAMLIAYYDVGNSGYGTAVVATISGTSVSFGSAYVFNSAASIWTEVKRDSSTGSFLILYQSAGATGRAITATVAGTVISYGTAATFNAAATARINAAYDAQTGRFVAAYVDSGNSSYGTAVSVSAQSVVTNSADVIGVATETKSAGQTCAIIPMGAIDTTPTGLSTGLDYYIAYDGSRTTTAGANVYVGRAVASNQLLLRGIAKR